MKIYKIVFCYSNKPDKIKSYPEGKEFSQEDFDKFFNEDEDLRSIYCYDKKGNTFILCSVE